MLRPIQLMTFYAHLDGERECDAKKALRPYSNSRQMVIGNLAFIDCWKEFRGHCCFCNTRS